MMTDFHFNPKGGDADQKFNIVINLIVFINEFHFFVTLRLTRESLSNRFIKARSQSYGFLTLYKIYCTGILAP